MDNTKGLIFQGGRGPTGRYAPYLISAGASNSMGVMVYMILLFTATDIRMTNFVHVSELHSVVKQLTILAQ